MAADRIQAIGQIGKMKGGVGDRIQEFREEGVVLMSGQIEPCCRPKVLEVQLTAVQFKHRPGQ